MRRRVAGRSPDGFLKLLRGAACIAGQRQGRPESVMQRRHSPARARRPCGTRPPPTPNHGRRAREGRAFRRRGAVQQRGQLLHARIGRTDLDVAPLAHLRLRLVHLAEPAIGERERIVDHRRARIDGQRLLERFGGARRTRGSPAPRAPGRTAPRPTVVRWQVPVRTRRRRPPAYPDPDTRRRATPAWPRRRARARAPARTRAPRWPAPPSCGRRGRGSTATAIPAARAPARSGNTVRPRRGTRRPTAGCPSHRKPRPALPAAAPRSIFFVSDACVARICSCTATSMRDRSGNVTGRRAGWLAGRSRRVRSSVCEHARQQQHTAAAATHATVRLESLEKKRHSTQRPQRPLRENRRILCDLSVLCVNSLWWNSGVAPRRARRLADKARRPRISGIFERGATQSARMHRPSNAARLSPRAVKRRISLTGPCLHQRGIPIDGDVLPLFARTTWPDDADPNRLRRLTQTREDAWVVRRRIAAVGARPAPDRQPIVARDRDPCAEHVPALALVHARAARRGSGADRRAPTSRRPTQ